MTGIEIEYLLGIYFLVSSFTLVDGVFKADAFKLIASVLLILLALLGKGFIS